MKRILLTALATVCVFTAGVFAGRWMQRTQPMPAPPMGIMGEIRDVPLSPSAMGPKSAPNRSMPKLQAEIEKLKPDIEEFKRKLEPIKHDFRAQLDALLTAEQREKLTRWSEHGSHPPKEGAADEKRPRPKDGLDSLFPIVVVMSTLERLTEELDLTPEQRATVLALLLKRRTDFLALVDSNPPPSLKLSRMAPLVPKPHPTPDK